MNHLNNLPDSEIFEIANDQLTDFKKYVKRSMNAQLVTIFFLVVSSSMLAGLIPVANIQLKISIIIVTFIMITLTVWINHLKKKEYKRLVKYTTNFLIEKVENSSLTKGRKELYYKRLKNAKSITDQIEQYTQFLHEDYERSMLLERED